jgi:hypothetical protein
MRGIAFPLCKWRQGSIDLNPYLDAAGLHAEK